MQRVELGQISLLECHACDGAWLDAADFERLCADRETQAAIIHRMTGAPRNAEPVVHYRPCLRCGKMMNRVNFGRMSGTVIDVCRGHGTFLDRGELHAIVSFIGAGGLERAREREIEQLHDERRRFEQLKAAEVRHGGAAAGTAGGDWTASDLLHLADWLKR
jgi:Zn-finger nucleic acid-binding protein